MYGVDLSSYQGKPDFAKVKAAGKEFAILRIASSSGKDASFESNMVECSKAGLLVGVYRYSYALTVDQAKAEAQKVVEYLAGRKLDLGVWLDLEWSKQRALGKAQVQKIAKAWMRIVRSAGYDCNIYCNLDWYRNVCGGLDVEYWIARYPKEDTGTMKGTLKPNVGEVGWQYSSKGQVPGISGNVDMDIWYHEKANGNPYTEPAGSLKYNKLLVKVVREPVKWLQWELRESGYDLVIDGKLGPNTDIAIRAFQKAAGLQVDGICGPATRAALKAAK